MVYGTQLGSEQGRGSIAFDAAAGAVPCTDLSLVLPQGFFRDFRVNLQHLWRGGVCAKKGSNTASIRSSTSTSTPK